MMAIQYEDLTTDQQAALNHINKWCTASRADPVLVLKGSAGSGKTTLLQIFVARSELNILLTAPTHRAVGVLASMMPRSEAKTIHSALGLKVKRVNHEYVLSQNKKNKNKGMEGVDIVVVDEGSMLDDEMLKFIIEDIEISNRRYLIVGDDAQLKSISEGTSPAFDLDDFICLYTIIRQASESPIIEIATQFRDKILFGHPIGPLKYGSNQHGSVVRANRHEFNDLIASDFDVENDVVIGWTNKNARFYNAYINKQVNGVDNGDMVVGQKIVFNEAHVDGDTVVVNNGYEDHIKSIMSGHHLKSGVDYITVRLDNQEGAFRVIQDKDRDAYESKLSYYRDQARREPALWRDYYGLSEMFADIRLPYSITTYKSQGSTYRNVYLDMGNIRQNRRDPDAVLRHCYVGITRASNSVIICN
jgi:exodeoxyribonuclease-5